MRNTDLFADLTDINTSDVELLSQESSRGVADLAASCGTNCNVANSCSCTIDDTIDE